MSILPSIRVAAAWLLLLSTGCSTFQRPAFNGTEGLNGAAVLLVPFRESKKRFWYGDSPRGRQLLGELKKWARENAPDPVIVEGRDARHILNLVANWTEDRITAQDWQSLATGLFEYVVVGDILSISLRKPGVIGLYDAQIAADYRVYNARSGRLAYEGTKTAEYGGGKGIGFTDTPFSENDSRVERRLLANLAAEIGKDLYGYYDE